jgi:peptidoglycan/LPS O-acetylase OafA/YrhL
MNKYSMNPVGLVVFIIFIGVGIYDFGLVVFNGVGGTISNAMVDYGIRAPFWVFVAGLVCGHLLFPMRRKE